MIKGKIIRVISIWKTRVSENKGAIPRGCGNKRCDNYSRGVVARGCDNDRKEV